MMDNIARLAEEQEKSTARKAQRDELVELVLSERFELFHSDENEAFASLDLSSRRETYAIKSAAFRQQVARLYYQATKRSAAGQALREALETLESQAIFGGKVQPVAIRCAEFEGALYLDLGNVEWDSVEVSPGGWSIGKRPPVRFRRPAKWSPLPMPDRGGTLDELRPFVNCGDDQSFALLLAWCLAALRSSFPTPILILQGEQGSAKSTTAKVIQSILDPGLPILRSAPKTEQDLVVAARNRRVLAFDNLSGVPDWLSDALCRLCTGGGYGARQLFTDSDEVVFEGTRAIILTGIDELARRHDLTDRALLLNLPAIPEERRQGDELLHQFEEAKPRIFGALLDALSTGLRRTSEVSLQRLPRMADFAKWSTACEPALGLPSGGFMAAYRGNRSEAAEQSLESDVVAVAVREFMSSRDEWEGRPTELLDLLRNSASDQVRASHAWPKAPNSLSSRIKRAAPVLRSAGIAVDFLKVGQGASRRRGIRLSKQPAQIVLTVLAGREATVNGGQAPVPPQPSEEGSAPLGTQAEAVADDRRAALPANGAAEEDDWGDGDAREPSQERPAGE
ncbi:MAG: hypothetical protein ACYCWW_11005 [Deltaproteobacteria bacterium]